VARTVDFCVLLQAEDGIRDATVTGVQTCALPISYATSSAVRPHGPGFTQSWIHSQDPQSGTLELGVENDERQAETYHLQLSLNEIGRASCREREGGAEDAAEI